MTVILSTKHIARLAPFVVFAFPSIFLYAQNAKEMNLGSILLPMLLCVALGYSLFVAAKLIYKEEAAAALFTALAGIMMFNYTFTDKLARRLVPMLRKWH